MQRRKNMRRGKGLGQNRGIGQCKRRAEGRGQGSLRSRNGDCTHQDKPKQNLRQTSGEK